MDNTTLGKLQDLILERVLTSMPLPGQQSPLVFPDLAYVTQADERLLLKDGYFGQTPHASVLSDTQVKQRAETGETAYVRFELPSKQAGDTTIRLRVFLAFADLEPLPLGEIVVTFSKRGGSWTTVPPTHVVAF